MHGHLVSYPKLKSRSCPGSFKGQKTYHSLYDPAIIWNCFKLHSDICYTLFSIYCYIYNGIREEEIASSFYLHEAASVQSVPLLAPLQVQNGVYVSEQRKFVWTIFLWYTYLFLICSMNWSYTHLLRLDIYWLYSWIISLWNRIYFTRISLGTPLKDYYVQVDTGSDLLWLNCNPCTACPRTNNLGVGL